MREQKRDEEESRDASMGKQKKSIYFLTYERIKGDELGFLRSVRGKE